MVKAAINSDPFDTEFRQVVAENIRSAKKSIKIVTGEISAYNYFDLRNAAEESAGKGVKIQVYAKIPNQDIVNRLIHNNVEIYIGDEDHPEHFMIVDDKQVTTSTKEKDREIPTPMGKRTGYTISKAPSKIRKYIQIFNSLKEKARKQKIHGTDPLIKALRNPISYG